MGCIKKILQIIILALALIGFVAIGGKDYITKKFESAVATTPEAVNEIASKVGDFSEVSEDYEIDKAASAFGYEGVLAEHDESGQKMVIVKSGKKPIVTVEDFEKDRVEKKLQDFIKKFKYQSMEVEDFRVIEKGTMSAYGKDNVPYVKFTAKISKLPVGKIEGIISAVESQDGEVKMLVSVNENNKYSQQIADEFFNKIK